MHALLLSLCAYHNCLTTNLNINCILSIQLGGIVVKTCTSLLDVRDLNVALSSQERTVSQSKAVVNDITAFRAL